MSDSPPPQRPEGDSGARPPDDPHGAPPSWGPPPPGGWGPRPGPTGDWRLPGGQPGQPGAPGSGASPGQPPGGWGPPPGQPPAGYPGAYPAPGWRPPAPPLRGGPLRPFTLGDVLDGMFRVVVANLRTIALALAFVVIPTNLVLVWLQRNVTGTMGFPEAFTNPAAMEAVSNNQIGSMLVALAGFYAAAVVVAALIQPLVVGLVLSIDSTYLLHGVKTTAGSAWRAAVRRWPALIGATIVGFLVTVAPFVPGIVLIALGFVFDNNTALFVVGGVLAFLAIFAAVAIAVLLLLAPVAVVVEQQGPVTALRRSGSLVRRRFWPFFGTMILVNIIVSFIGVILGAAPQTIGQFISGAGGYVLQSSGTILVELVSTPLVATALVLLYTDIRIRTEALDLQIAAARLGPPPDGGAPPPAGAGGAPTG